MGPTKVYRAAYTEPESLRAVFGLTDTRNGLHGSDSPESAVREIGFFFPEFDAAQWLERERTRCAVMKAGVTSLAGVTSDCGDVMDRVSGS